VDVSDGPVSWCHAHAIRLVRAQQVDWGSGLVIVSQPAIVVFDPNAILVGALGEPAAGYLPTRLAGDVTRSLDQGYAWRCYVRRILHAPGTDNWGITVCMVKLNRGENEVSSGHGMTGGEFLARYYPEYKQRGPVTRPSR
jgi:hypothetical protein